MLNLIKMMVLLSAMLAVTGCDADKDYVLSHKNGKTDIIVNCYRSSKPECLQYLDAHCKEAQLYLVEEHSSGALEIFAYCQE